MQYVLYMYVLDDRNEPKGGSWECDISPLDNIRHLVGKS